MSESFENTKKKPSLSAEKAKWDAILAAEGMPDELESTAEDEHTDAYNAAVLDLYVHYATTATDNYGAHRQTLEALRSRVKAGGGTEDEYEALSEDFAREVEDTVSNLQKNALEYARAIAAARPTLASRPEAVAKMVTIKLKEETGGTVSEDALSVLAEKAAGTLH